MVSQDARNWPNQACRIEASPKLRSKCESRAPRSRSVSLTSNTQTLAILSLPYDVILPLLPIVSLFLRAHQRGVIDHYAPVHDHGEAVLLSVFSGILVDYARLQPQDLGPRGHGVTGDRHDLLAATEHVHNIYALRYLLDDSVRLLAKNGPLEAGVYREDLIPEPLQSAGDGIASAVRFTGESHDRYVAGFL